MKELIQIFYKVDIRTGVNYDDITVNSEKTIFPEMLEWFASTWFARNFPHNEEDLPKGVELVQHFLTWDRKAGVCLCVGYYIDENIVNNTDAFKKTLGMIIDDAEGQFSDGWGESFEQHHFKIGRSTYSPQVNSDIVAIVAPIPLHENFFVRWKSVDEIEHVEWVFHMANDAFNICYNKKRHEENISKGYYGSEMKKIFEFIEKNKKHFFVPGWKQK